VKELTQIDLGASTPAQNVSSWVIERLGNAPQGSEVVEHANVRVLIRKVRRQRVLEAAIAIHGREIRG
jgi:hypothetical protein